MACWTPVGSDWDLVANKSGPTRLGFVLMLKYFELEGQLPQFRDGGGRAMGLSDVEINDIDYLDLDY